LAETHDRGLAANDPNIYEKILPLDLRAIKNTIPIPKNKLKGSFFVPLSPEET
jgi:hypothetical protein